MHSRNIFLKSILYGGDQYHRVLTFQHLPKFRGGRGGSDDVDRRGSIRVVKGEDSVSYLNTRGGCPFFTGISRGCCKSCKTPGGIETFRDLVYRLFFGDAQFCYAGYQFCYAGYHFKQPVLNKFSMHIFYGSASKGAKELADKDGRPKRGGFTGILAITAAAFGNLRVLAVASS